MATTSGHAGREAIKIDHDTPLVLVGLTDLFREADDDERSIAVLAKVQQLRVAWLESRQPVLLVEHGIVRVDQGKEASWERPPPIPFETALPPIDASASVFLTTNIDYVLRRFPRRMFVVAGKGAETAIESTVRDGADKGYTITYVSDAVLGSSASAEAEAEAEAEARARYNLKGFARIRTTEEVVKELGQATAVPRTPQGPGGKTALLVIDVQKYCADVGGGGMHDAAHADDEDGAAGVFGRRIKETMVPNIARLLRRSRAMGHEVVFTVIENLTRDGRDRSLDYKLSCIDVPKGHRHAQVLEEIAPIGDEILLPKTSASVFMSTTLGYLLTNLGVSTLVLCGMITNQCVESSARDAAGLGYELVMVNDATTAHTPEDQAAAEQTLRRIGRVMTTEDALTDPRSPLAPPSDAPIVRLAVLRAEGNSTYGDCIIPSFQELFRAAAAASSSLDTEDDNGSGGSSSDGGVGKSSREAHPPDLAPVVELCDFGVKKGQYPPPETWDDYDGFLLPGSYSSAYETEAWIQEFKRVIRDLHAHKKRMVGVCFGHQIIAEALGGKVVRNPKGLTVGRREFVQQSGTPSSSLYYYHGDIVETPPPGARVLGVDGRCSNHGMAIGTTTLTVQGHPEFGACAPTGHAALKAILVEQGLQAVEWGERAETDSLLWAQRFLRHFMAR